MANIELTYEEPSTTLDEYMRYCQIIADAFTKALDQNECNVKVVVGMAQEITDLKNEVEDLWNIMKPDTYIPNLGDSQSVYKDSGTGTYTPVTDPAAKLTPSEIAAIKKKIKDSCYDCDFGWPKVSFENNFNFSFSKLKTALQLYSDAFKQLANPNMCHAAGALNFACLQDLLKLITLLLSAYTAILAIRKLSGISLSAFIKGVISGLLGQLLGSLKLQIDLSQTGLACIIKVFEELAANVPDGASLNGVLPEHLLYDLGLQLETTSIDNGTLEPMSEEDAANMAMEVAPLEIPNFVESTDAEGNTVVHVDGVKDISSSLYEDGYPEVQSNVEEKSPIEPPVKSMAANAYQKALQNLSDPNGENMLKQFTKALKKDSKEYQDNISASFKWVNETVAQATDDFNNTLSQMFGLLDYFQCETARSGTGFLEVLEYIQKLMNVINLLSSIVAIVAKKQVEKLCKTKGSVSDMSSVVREDIELGGSHDLDPTELIEEFLGKVVEQTRDENDNIVPIIYDKDADTLLPKLNLQTCNLKDFIEAHKIDNIIERAVERVQKEQEDARKYSGGDYVSSRDVSNFPHVSIPKGNIVDKSRWKVYPVKYTPSPYTKDTWNENDKGTQEEALGKVDNSAYGLQSILDFVYNNPLDNTKDESKVDRSAITPDTSTNPTNSTEDMTFRNKIETPFYSPPGKDKKSFENECRSIDDVLSILGNLQGK